MENAIQLSRSLLQFSAASQVRAGSWSICKPRARLTFITLCWYCGMPAISCRQQLIDDPLAFFRTVENEQRRQIAFQPDQGFLACADTGDGQADDQEQLANAHNARPSSGRQCLMSRANRRFSSDGSVFAQLCDLRRVIAKFLEYLCIVLTQLRPDPFTITGCL